MTKDRLCYPKIKGKLHFEKEVLDFYSVDSSSYRIKPRMVAIPKDKDDVKQIVSFAKRHNIPLIPRGAGTGLVGSSIGDGIIIDFKNLNQIRVYKNFVRVGPGVLKGHLDKILAKHNKFLSPNPSVGPYCTIGGMIGTNAGGSKTIKYGAMIDNLLELEVVTGRNEVVKLPSNSLLSKKIVKLAKEIDLTKFPNVSKNSCGYRLDKVQSTMDSHKIIAGSEGTLGIVLSAKIRIFDVPQTRRLFVICYNDKNALAKDCQKIVQLGPSSIEFVDQLTLKNFPYEFPKSTKSLLLVEFDADISTRAKKLKALVGGSIFFDTTKSDNIDKWWKYRDLALSFSLKNILMAYNVPHIIEDAVVSVSCLDRLFSLIDRIASEFTAQTIVYGHAGNGNIHVRLVLKNKTKSVIRKIAKFYFDGIIKLGGSITGEHGDGLARSEFVGLQYGKKNLALFRRLKTLFDPSDIMNPGKILTQKGTMTKHLQ